MWAVIGAVLALWLSLRVLKPRKVREGVDKEAASSKAKASTSTRVYRTIGTLRQQYLLPELWPKVFGRVSRLQLTILAIISGYLLIFS